MFSATTLPIRCAAAAAALRPRASTCVRPCLSAASYSTATASRPAAAAAAAATRPSQLLQLQPPATKLHASARPAAPRTTGPSAAPRVVAVRFSTASSRRAAATTSGSSASSARSVAAASASPAETLTWNRFLALRKTRRRLSLVCSVFAAVTTTAVGAQLVLGYDLDSLGAQTFGLDPIIVMGLATIGCGCLGWLLGPAIGDGVFRLAYRRIGRQIADKEKQFFQRIKKFRVDPTQSSLNNPVPDFYGEKIGSVADYRRWLKDQRAFNLKTSGRPRGGAGAVALGKRKSSTVAGLR